jgi:6-pyruvoyltetrahydropterin/6-carboxytetrahydropterin synthase
MLLTLHTEFVIDSAHKLEAYKGKCKFVHGHSWRIEVWFRGLSKDCNRIGILADFGIVKKLKDKMDHKYLNDLMPAGTNPTAENLVQYVYAYLRKKISRSILVQVKVWETSIGKETWCAGGDDIITKELI